MDVALALVVAAFASYRLYRLIGKDEWPPSKWFRERLEREAGADSAWVTWIECPWCLGMSVSAGAVAWTDYLVGLPLPLLCWLAVSTVVGLIGNFDG